MLLRVCKIIIFFLQVMFYKTFVIKKPFAFVYLFLNYFIMSLNFKSIISLPCGKDKMQALHK